MPDYRSIEIPAFGTPLAVPAIPSATYAARCDAALAAAGTDWLYVYADREHSANMLHLAGIEPRFEEGVLLLGKGRRILLLGNESLDYAPRAGLDGLETVLSQSLSLMAQWRDTAPNLAEVLAEIGVKSGDSIGLVGWKYLEAAEGEGFLLPESHVRALAKVAGRDGLTDATRVLMHPATGQRSIVDADQIATFEWGAARASDAAWRIVSGTRPGMSEMEAASLMAYAGEPLSCHVMTSGAAPGGGVVGLASPSGRLMQKGDGVTCGIGYWGGLSSRAGILTDEVDEAFLKVCKDYFGVLRTWYETAEIGVTGGDMFDAVAGAFDGTGMKSALNPGHLVSYDEWAHSPIRPGSTEAIVSGMPFQVDVIPVPQKAGQALNCEDAVVFADDTLRGEIAAKHPEVWARIEARRAFLADQIGVALKPSILPLSNTPLCLAPFWMAPDKLITA
ncbi:hypothetical protein ACXN5S_07415 [Pseudoroseicyclus sp. H15]